MRPPIRCWPASTSTGRLALVTGASSGLGAESARALAARGAEVVITGAQRREDRSRRRRDPQRDGQLAHQRAGAPPRTARQRARLRQGVPRAPRECSTSSSRTPGSWPARWRAPPKAGSCSSPPTTSGHFLLTGLLAPALLAGAPARVVAVSSAGHTFSPVVFDDIHFERRPYDKWSAYGQSKTANILFAVELDRRLAARGVRAFAIHPGMIATELGRHLTEEDFVLLGARARSASRPGRPRARGSRRALRRSSSPRPPRSSRARAGSTSRTRSSRGRRPARAGSAARSTRWTRRRPSDSGGCRRKWSQSASSSEAARHSHADDSAPPPAFYSAG